MALEFTLSVPGHQHMNERPVRATSVGEKTCFSRELPMIQPRAGAFHGCACLQSVIQSVFSLYSLGKDSNFSCVRGDSI